MRQVNTSPLEIGLDLLGVSRPHDMLAQMGVVGVEGDAMISTVADRVERTIADHLEMKSEIVVAGLYVLLHEVDDMATVKNLVLPLMDRAVHNALAC